MARGSDRMIKLTQKQCECGTQQKYDENYDAVYCPACKVWLEKVCQDKDCEFCVGRPERPGE